MPKSGLYHVQNVAGIKEWSQSFDKKRFVNKMNTHNFHLTFQTTQVKIYRQVDNAQKRKCIQVQVFTVLPVIFSILKKNSKMLGLQQD